VASRPTIERTTVGVAPARAGHPAAAVESYGPSPRVRGAAVGALAGLALRGTSPQARGAADDGVREDVAVGRMDDPPEGYFTST
jgi:hypothetical protein